MRRPAWERILLLPLVIASFAMFQSNNEIEQRMKTDRVTIERLRQKRQPRKPTRPIPGATNDYSAVYSPRLTTD